MSRITGRSPNASAQISTPGCDPSVGWMKAASQVPSGVLIMTSVSTTGNAAADAELVAAIRPAATDTTMKSRREISVSTSFDFSEPRSSAVIASLLFRKWLSPGFPISNLSFRETICQELFAVKFWISVGIAVHFRPAEICNRMSVLLRLAKDARSSFKGYATDAKGGLRRNVAFHVEIMRRCPESYDPGQ